jgi:beta-lactamase class D
MKIHLLLIFILLFFSCSTNNNPIENEQETSNIQFIEMPEFQLIVDSVDVKGAILIYDFQKEIYYSNDFDWAQKGKLPASTFKIVNSIIAFETGVVEDDSTLFKWDGSKRAIKNWEQDLTFKNAFHFSCVPCYQDVARSIGEKRMNDYLAKLEYGNMKVDSNSIDLFWLQGDSRITSFQQIDFLKRFYNSQLSISKRTEELMKKMMVIEENESYKMSGKTGWSNANANEIDNGWFVGYIESGNEVYFFSTNIEPGKQFNMEKFSVTRKNVTFEALKQLNIIK